MSQVLTANEIRETKNVGFSGFRRYLPAILTIVGAFLMLFLRIEIGGKFISDGALMMIALACYICRAFSTDESLRAI